jgi:hypothetical protein
LQQIFELYWHITSFVRLMRTLSAC